MRQASFTERPKNAQTDSNFISILTFSYTLNIFNKARKNKLEEGDLTLPLDEHKSSYLGEKLATIWSKEVKKSEQKFKRPKLARALFKCFQWPIIGLTAAATILEMIVKISQPLFLKLLLRYYSTENMEKLKSNSIKESRYTFLLRMLYIYDLPQGPITKEEAAFFTSGIALSAWLSIAIIHPYLMGVMHLGMKMRVACCSLIYRKALRLRIELAGGNMTGNVINLISNDVNRFDNGIMFLPYALLTPIQVVFITYFLYLEVGFAAVYGIIAFILVLPLQLWLAIRVLSLRYRTALKTDERIREMNEMLQAIQVIKMYTWEHIFMNIVDKNREEEVNILREMGYIRGVMMSLVIFSFRFSIFITAVSCIMMGGQITAEKIFVATAFLLILCQTVSIYFPQTLVQGAELLVSIYRLEEFLFLGEAIVVDKSPLEKNPSKDQSAGLTSEEVSVTDESYLKIENASAKFGDDIVLQEINLEAGPSLLTIVIGPVGSGKTALLQLILGELRHFEGSVDVKGEISYASQEPWLFAGSIRRNILFGREFNRRRYEAVCFVCALNTDFKLLPYGDKTWVGEKGAALSGGQKARVNLARAVYKHADIYLLDDPLSAVDSRVGQHMFEVCIRGYLSDKIVVLVTHQLQYLEDADQIVLFKDGAIEAVGNYDYLNKAGLDFSILISEQLTETFNKVEKKSSQERKSSVRRTLAEISRKSLSTVTFIDLDSQMPAASKEPKEAIATGGVDFSVYKGYFQAGAHTTGILFMLCLFILTQLFASGADFFISKWVNMEELHSGSNEILSRNSCVAIYTTIIICTVSVGLARSFYFFYFCMNASQNLHNNMFRSVVETRMNFFHKYSTGTILNRFSKDLGAIDEVLPNALIDTMQIFLNVIGVIIVVGIISYYLLIPTFLMCIILASMRNFYLKVSTNIKRLEGTSKSPVFAHITSTLLGLATIRSNRTEQILTEEFDRLQDIHGSAWFMFIATSRAFGYWVDNICFIYLAIVAFQFLFAMNQGGNVGLAITQTLTLMGLFQWGIRQSTEVENQMTSVERILEYTRLEPEPNLKSDPFHEPPTDWPTSGKIEFVHAYMNYGPGDAHVLRDVNFLIENQEKIGIVGRTGAGKSSLIAAMFRLAYFYGEVRIDNLDISKLCLHDLRRRISIIPQEAVLFSGTLRYNLDPNGEFDTDLIMKVLIDLENKDALVNGEACLQHMIVEGGANVSVGQRQIICLGRALLRSNKIIVMDEATANMDAKTDKFIQSVIRTQFSNCTVITIAHRLHTIMDSDKVLVMDAGEVAEFDHPYVLLQNPEGIFKEWLQKRGSTWLVA